MIDLGLEKLPYYDGRTNTDTLLLRRCSRASAKQRAGRAGRVAPGVCLRCVAHHSSPIAHRTSPIAHRTSLTAHHSSPIESLIPLTYHIWQSVPGRVAP